MRLLLLLSTALMATSASAAALPQTPPLFPDKLGGLPIGAVLGRPFKRQMPDPAAGAAAMQQMGANPASPNPGAGVVDPAAASDAMAAAGQAGSSDPVGAAQSMGSIQGMSGRRKRQVPAMPAGMPAPPAGMPAPPAMPAAMPAPPASPEDVAAMMPPNPAEAATAAADARDATSAMCSGAASPLTCIEQAAQGGAATPQMAMSAVSAMAAAGDLSPAEATQMQREMSQARSPAEVQKKWAQMDKQGKFKNFKKNNTARRREKHAKKGAKKGGKA